MVRKKSSAPVDGVPSGGASSSSSPQANGATAKKPANEPSTSALIICRNKHWRYISSFHGPWLQLPPEVLESLAHSNYLSPRPHPIDPAVFYDLVKIRRAVDEATNLAVRATSGLTSAALNNSLNGGNHMLGNAAALGIGYGGGGTSKLSRERKHRMRELATSKLSQAYHLDEIAASVATMQSASTLEDVAQLVLQRDPGNLDAKYVHFFHEKIPSRMMAQCTPLDTLNDIIAERPNDGSPLRTRALTRIFKQDFVNSAKDLSEALSTARYLMAQHRAGKDQLVLAKTYQEQHGRDWRQEVKIADEDQPSSLETQLLFHRAGVYFTIACQHVHAALDGLREAEEVKARREAQMESGQEVTPETPEDVEGNKIRAEARKQVRQNAKRAIRDYTAFLSHFDYTPGISADLAEEFLRRLGGNSGNSQNHTSYSASDKIKPNMNRLLESSNTSSSTSDALVPIRRQQIQSSDRSSWPKLPPPEIHSVSSLFSPLPPPSLPPYPPTSTSASASAAATAFADSHESITYHPLLTDALHSLLLCHALVQTPPKEHLRHAHNAARLARICDGYPIFLAARSPARADWIEVLRRAGNWIGLSTPWETLCRPAPLPGQTKSNNPGTELAKNGAKGPAGPKPETETQRRERQKHEAILEALADERVVDEESFQRAVRARERRFREDEIAATATQTNTNTNTNTQTQTQTNNSPSTTASTTSSPQQTPAPAPATPQPKRWAQDDGREYPISTERAEAIARWVREAPAVVEGSGKKRKGRKGGVKKMRERCGGLVESVETLGLDEGEDEDE
ncbi:hypothetical protein T440DRAFT_440564 [Plenodomus tracheiphilus IPT5]|uniref:Histidine kinase group protein n=1 Tax=Plenodomus tracheiphilus IPT5 TaxID=1408161 RepID=A0A6A7BL39_9PLEO|nr:hypothetical protein T440DRAFT_440564 [Plenodomus tracheiphilus IPT5]